MKKIVVILFIITGVLKVSAQSNIVFQHLNTSNGLSYIGINTMCVDKKGNLWIATGNGLNMFNGKNVDKYFATEYPQLQNSNVVDVKCDSSNRIWILTAGGNVAMLDAKRQMHRVGLYENNKFVKTIGILNAEKGNIVLYTAKGNYTFNRSSSLSQHDSITNQHFSFLPIKGFFEHRLKGGNRLFALDDDYYLLIHQEAFLTVNHKTNTVEKKFTIPNCNALIKWGDKEVLICDRITYEVKAVNLSSGEIAYPFKDLKDQFGRNVNAFFYNAERINKDEYLFTSFNAGIYIYNAVTKKIYNYKHNLSDPSSMGNNTQTHIATGRKGWVFIMCNPNGISYFNTNDIIGNQNVFTDNMGKGFDGYVAGIASKDNNTYYVGTPEGLLEWKRNTNTTSFIDFTIDNGKSAYNKEEVFSVLIDNKDQIWTTTLSHGIIVFDKNRKLVRHISNTGKGKYNLKIKRISQLLLSPAGDVWACGRNGICKIDPDTFEVDSFDNTPLSQFDSIFCSPILFTDKDNLWFVSTKPALYHYNLVSKKLENYTIKNGLASNIIFTLNCDSLKNIYVGTDAGLNILYTDGRIKTISQKDGLLIDRVEGLLLDKHNRMWIGNDIGLVCYNPADSSLVTFDQRHGLSIYGFRVGSYFQTPNGEFAFGTPHGLQYFHPDSLFNKKITLNALISKIETKSIVSNITETSVFNLPASANQVTFYFSTVDYSPHLRTYYEYQLMNIDKDWIKVADQNSVRYNSLPPGKYVFKVRVSNDNKNWQEADNEVTIIIATPFYKTWWFKLAGALLGIGLIWLVINYYRKKQQRQKEQLETEVVINYFASQINSHQNTDTLLWDVAKNCISKLGFEDCVIYLLDEQRHTLVQKAAYGPKNPVDFTIHQPMEIPVGKGIVGTVASTGKSELVNNTAADSRYIVDDASRISEIAVPIIIDRKVIGVIDSEHPQKNFFSAKHLQILSTVSALCANQIQRAKAEEEKQTAKIELLENKQKAVESRLQSLRLQMNPHFLFNALNSIQQMILANEDIVATKYLSRFSKLLRAILVHSDKETITLKEELEILSLYIELESIRFKESFNYTISVEDDIETEEVKIPTLLVQPFVENAIWHGLMHKEGPRLLNIAFTETGDFIKCVIEDNGVGREKAAAMKLSAGQDKKHTSKGIEVSRERLKTLRAKDGREGTITIIDMTDTNGLPSGTKVEINFPIQN